MTRRIIPVLLFSLIGAGMLMSPAWSATPKAAVKSPSPNPTPAPTWKKEIVFSFQLAQSSFDNWAQGGEDSLAWQTGLKSKFIRDKKMSNWTHSLDIAYGQSRTENQVSKKTVDEVKAESVYTFKTGHPISPFLSLAGRTQMTAGYTTLEEIRVKTSDFLDPGTFTESAGLGYVRGETFTTRLGAALRETVTRNFPGYADNLETSEIEKTRTEFGATSVTEYKHKLGAASLFTSKLDLFSNLKAADQVVVHWDNVLSTQITKLLTFGAEVDLFYDRSISKSRQIKQFLSAGFSYSLL